MLIKEISIFLPNKIGSLASVTEVLLRHHIDIRAIVAFDTSEFGILRMIVSHPDRAVEVLTQDGFVAKISNVIIVRPEDHPGSLYEIFALMAEHDMNIEYTYSFVMQKGTMPYFALKIKDAEGAVKQLIEKGITVINAEEINR